MASQLLEVCRVLESGMGQSSRPLFRTSLGQIEKMLKPELGPAIGVPSQKTNGAEPFPA
jgi:hypothetical protein